MALLSPPRVSPRRAAPPEPSRVVVVAAPQLRALAKYRPRTRRYLSRLPGAVVASSLADAAASGILRGARVDCIRIHPVARGADGSPLLKTTGEDVRALLRHGRVLARDAMPLAQGLEALGAGAVVVRLGTPQSLESGEATEIHPRKRETS